MVYNQSEIIDKDWEDNLRRYEDRYVVKRATDRMWVIKCHKNNIIDTYDLFKNILVFSTHNCLSRRGLNIYYDKLNKSNKWWGISQEGDLEANIIFKEEDLEDLAHILLPKRRRKDYRNLKKVPTEKI
jgi:hypothetical protein